MSDRAESTRPRASVWSVWIDTGGTFTDCVALDPAGGVHRAKVLSSGAVRGRLLALPAPNRLQVSLPWPLPPDFFRGWRVAPRDHPAEVLEILASTPAENLSEAPPPDFSSQVPSQVPADWSVGTGAQEIVELTVNKKLARQGHISGAARATPSDQSGGTWAVGNVVELGVGEEAAVVAARVVTRTAAGGALPQLRVRLATTRGTNALLERTGAPTALFITRGFGDLLAIGTQQRPDLFALRVEKPPVLYQEVVEVDERLAADGSVLAPLVPEALDARLEELRRAGIQAAAVALLHSYRNPEPERRLAAHLEAAGFRHVSCSSSVAPLIRIVPRAETAVVDAYLATAVGEYLARIGRALPNASLRVMTSAGGLVGAERFRPKDSLLSGPAGGVVGAAEAGARSGLTRIIAFDMGGTSTDVARSDGQPDYRFETHVGGVRLLAPALAIESVAAGGGSICRLEGGVLKVGPGSAGALPGPACYGAGGPLTLTDVNLLLGRLDAGRFELPLDPRAAAEAAGRLRAETARVTGESLSEDAMLAGLLRIADEKMAEAVRRISIREGYRPADFALVAFGGAGAQHACSLAELLDMDRVLVPADAGLLSAWGLGAARLERFAERQVLEPLERCEQRLDGWLAELAREARAALAAEDLPADRIEVALRRVHLRFAGQDATLAIDWEGPKRLREAFRRAHLDHFGYEPERRPVEVESLRVVAAAAMPAATAAPPPEPAGPAPPLARTEASIAGRRRTVPVFERRQLVPGHEIVGPALVFEAHSATVIGSSWRGRVDGAAALVLERAGRHG